jgi:hypothetical protein
MCEQQYFLEYVLGLRGPSNKKADKGTIVHKVLELLAIIKQSQQNKENSFVDDIVGEVDVNNYNLDHLTELVYKYYSGEFKHHTWDDKDYKDCHAWVYKAINYHNGMFDPRNRNILCPEQHFDLEIKEPWAAFNYNINNENVSGYLGLKGTIDLITQVDSDTIEVIDWKTGKRLNWATGEEKTQEKLEQDPQLRIYHYAISKLYPHIKNVMITIYFINDGGPFSVCFEDKHMKDTENMLREKFEIIKKTKRPRLNKTWMCTKLCHFGKTTFENTHVLPIIEYRDNHVTPKDKFMTKCEQIKHDIELKGIDNVVDEYQAPGYTISKYKPPGAV